MNTVPKRSSAISSPYKKKLSQVFVEKPDILDDIIIDSMNTRASSPSYHHLESGSLPSSFSGLSVSNKSRKLKSSESHLLLLKEQQKMKYMQAEAMVKAHIQKSIEIAADKEERKFPRIMGNLDRATQFLEHIDKDLQLHEETQQNKVRRQFEDWNTMVHGSIQQKISKTVNSIDPKALNQRRNEDFNKFLEITNRKPAIFRDIILENEYDPLEPNKKCIKATTGYLKDPINIDAQKAAYEGAMLGETPKQQKLCKETLDVRLWAAGQIEATPHGSFARMMASKNKSNGNGEGTRTSNTSKSSIVFDHFDYPTDKAAVDREMPRGKCVNMTLMNKAKTWSN